MKAKKILFSLVGLAFITGTLMVGCKPSTKEEQESQEKVQEARANVQDAKDSLRVAKKAATDEEWNTFKKQADSIVTTNEAQIAELKLRMKKTGKTMDTEYQKNIEILEQKNHNIKLKIDTFQNDANSDWQSFKREFKDDMDGMGKAFKNLTVDNKK